ncbi:MAG: hypothetical protein ACREFD_11825 [Stellaceae bacterium]
MELPSGYTHTWHNDKGEYVMSNNPSHDPNVGSEETWQSLGRPLNPRQNSIQ